MITLLAGLAFAGSFTGVDGQMVTVSGAERVVALGGAVTESVFAIGGAERVVAVDTSSSWPASVNTLPKVGYHRQLGAEAVLSLEPDLILATTDAGPEGVIAQLRAVGIPVAVLSGEPSVEGAVSRLEGVGALLDLDATDAIGELRREITSIDCPEKRPRVAFLFGHGAGALTVAGTGTAADAIIRLGCGENAVTGYESYKPLTDEALAAVRPDVLLTTTSVLEATGGVDAVKALPAVKVAGIDQIIALDALMLLGFGPRTGEAAAALSKALR